MNKEVGYILRGFFLMFILIAGIWVVNFLFSIKTPDKSITKVMDIPTPAPSDEAIAHFQKGELLFLNNCSACHSILKIIDGPRLDEVEQRVPDRKLLYAWIRNSNAVLKSGNKYFTELVKVYNNAKMSEFPQLTDGDIDAILEYIRQAKHSKQF